MFNTVSGNPSFPEMETEVLKFWRENGIFQKSIDLRKGCPDFVFYDGPPFATGLPHYGHLLAGAIKDVVPRYQTMAGKRCDRVFGWDCHGLPVEYEMEKELNLSGKKEIEQYGVDRFNECCRGIVLRYTREWENVVHRMGRWVDFKRGYRTMDLKYMESTWWVFKQLWDKGLIYEGHKILPYCPRCATPLSNFEANLGYEEVEDPAITIKFKVTGEDNTYILAWTTTPWTLPSNLALAAGPEISYVKVADGKESYIIAESRLHAYYKEQPPEITARFKGSELAGRRYEPLFPYFSELSGKGAFKVVAAAFVGEGDGTGIVHMAPGFGEDDAAAAKENGVPEVCPVDESCRFTAEVPDYQGQYVKDTDKEIIKRLKIEGKLVHRGSIKHNYPHCYRDDSPLIYRAVSTWFVKIDAIKEKMLKANSQMSWTPDHIKDGRFGKWLENAKDWAISRNRYWGSPLPVWRSPDGKETVCAGSVGELERLTGQKISDIHKHFVDKLEIPSSKGGEPLRRIPQVLDCWFESGSMPYAQNHYPFENKAHFDKNFPADFIAEGLDQTRGWFYTLVVLSAALFDKPPAMNVIVNGLVLASDGQKMSKRKKNYPDPMDVINAHGADALRLFMLGSPVVRAEDLKFSEDGVKEILRKVLLPLWNSYSFFVTYANVDKWAPKGSGDDIPKNVSNPLDKWILSSLTEMVEEIRGHMDGYQLQKAANRFEKFIDDLTNWYIRRSRRRFWKSQNDKDKDDAYKVLYHALVTFAKTAAPFIPFVTEEIYRNLRTKDMPASVHLCDFPEPVPGHRDERLEKQMELAMTAVSLGRFLRTQHSLKVRQPLARAIIVANDEKALAALRTVSGIIAEELNVKEVEFQRDESGFVTHSAKANFKTLGPRFGKNMKAVAESIASLDAESVASLLSGTVIEIELNGVTETLSAGDVIVQRGEKEGIRSASEAGLTVALDTNLTQDLMDEGFAREFVSKIQNIRKEMDFDVSDRIDIRYSIKGRHAVALDKHSVYIKTETLAVSLFNGIEELNESVQEIDINGVECVISVDKHLSKTL